MVTIVRARCVQCSEGPEACGIAPPALWGNKAECQRGCGVPTVVRTACGAPSHFACQPAASEMGRAPAVLPRQRPAGEWLGQRRPAPRGGQDGALQPRLRDELAERVTAVDLDRAVKLWNASMRSISYLGGHVTATNILNGSLRHRQVPEVPMWRREWLAPLEDGGQFVARRWMLDGAQLDAGEDLAGFDVNGQYLSAAASEMGTGQPERLEWPGDGVLNRPGFVRVAALENAPWGILAGWSEGQWMATPLARYLVDAGAELLMSEALTWKDHRRWLDPHVGLFREARTYLYAHGGNKRADNPDPVAVAVLDVVKDLYTRVFGGILRSRNAEDNEAQPGINHGWAAQTIATAQARMFRALDKTAGGRVVGIHADAAWFALPAGYEVPPGLEMSDQLGKWKTAGRVAYSDELAAMVEARRGEAIRKALKDSEASRGRR